MRSERGVTMVELLVTLSIAGILLTLGVPSMRDFLVRNRVESSGNQLMASLAFARSEAIKRGARVTVCKSADNASCGGTGWESGWIVFLDSNNNGTRETSGVTPAEALFRIVQAHPAGITIRGNNNFINYISFLSAGASNTIGTFAVCSGSDEATARSMSINSTGRPRYGRDTNSDGIPEKESGGASVNITSCESP